MRAIDLMTKDLKQLTRDWKSAVFLVVMPILFTLLFSFVFGGTGEEDPRLAIGFLDQDSSTASAHLLAMLEGSSAVRPVAAATGDVTDLEQQVTDGDLAAALVVPAGLGRQALDLTAAAGPELVLIADTSTLAGQAARDAVQPLVGRLMGAAQAAQASARAYEEQGGTADQAFVEAALERTVAAWQDPPLSVVMAASGTAAADSGEGQSEQASSAAQSSAGIMVQFAMAGIMGAAGMMVIERKSGTMRRLLTTATSRAQIILGHFLAMFVMILAQLVLLILFGQIVLGVPYLSQPLAILVVVVATALWSASLGLFIGTVSRTDDQVIMLSLVLMLGLSGLGGAWMPLEFTSQAFQTVGHLTPIAWAIDGLKNVVVRGQGLESVLLPGAVLLGYAAVLGGLAVWRFRFEE